MDTELYRSVAFQWFMPAYESIFPDAPTLRLYNLIYLTCIQYSVTFTSIKIIIRQTKSIANLKFFINVIDYRLNGSIKKY